MGDEAAARGTVVLRLYPPYSNIVGKTQVEVDLGPKRVGPVGSAGPMGPMESAGSVVAVVDLFERLCDDYPGLRELIFPAGRKQDFPGYTSVLRDGVTLKAGDVLRPGDFIEVLTALSGG